MYRIQYKAWSFFTITLKIVIQQVLEHVSPKTYIWLLEKCILIWYLNLLLVISRFCSSFASYDQILCFWHSINYEGNWSIFITYILSLLLNRQLGDTHRWVFFWGSSYWNHLYNPHCRALLIPTLILICFLLRLDNHFSLLWYFNLIQLLS